MNDDSLIQAMPDVVAFVRPDGLITHHLGGRGVPFIRGLGGLAGRRLADALQPAVAALITRLVRRAIAERGKCEADFTVDGAGYQARVSALGPERVLCVIRHEAVAQELKEAGPGAPGSADRRGFAERLQRSVSEAALRERPLAVGVIFLDGLGDIGRLIDFSIEERILSEVLRGLPVCAGAEGSSWYVGQIGEALLGVVVEGARQRDEVQAIAASLCDAIARPIQIKDATFHLTPCAGVAILGQDASKPQALIEHARAAMFEARRSAAGTIHFYSDTLRMLPVARLDIERELRAAIGEGQIFLHYAARCDLMSGELRAIQAYMRWTHPLRGPIPPSQFLPIANATGLAPAVSRAAFERLAADYPRIRGQLRAQAGAQVPVSFGALRQHVSTGQLLRDCRRLATAEFDPAGLELRVAERTLATLSRPERTLGALAEMGARLVIDEMGRSFSSLSRLSRLPLAGLQIDRALAVAAVRNGDSLRCCRTIAALAAALDAVAIASGIDDAPAQALLLECGCVQGMGDLYPYSWAFQDSTAEGALAGASAF